LQVARKDWNPTPFVFNSFNDLTLARDYLLLGFALTPDLLVHPGINLWATIVPNWPVFACLS
jgi:hypothetical protein